MKKHVNILTYSEPVTVARNEFNNAADKTKLSGKMQEIYDFMQKIAVDNFDEPAFRQFYEGDFIGANYTYILNKNLKRTDKRVGFLFTSFHKTGTNNPTYIGKAFPAVKSTYRGKGYRYDRGILYAKFIQFYLNEILKIELITHYSIQALISAITEEFNFYQFIKLTQKIITDLNRSNKMEIQLNVENPTTYEDLCKFGLNFTGLKASELKTNVEKQNWEKVKNLDSLSLIGESYMKSLTINGDLKVPEFYVNISQEEREKAFMVDEQTSEFKRFYLWMNYDFPKKCFYIIIPVNPGNIMNVVFKIIESEIKCEIPQSAKTAIKFLIGAS